MSEISHNETTYPYRAGNLFKIEYDFTWYNDGFEGERHHIEPSRRLHKFMAPYVSKFPKQALFNYRDLDVGTVGQGDYLSFSIKYYGTNFLE